MNSLRAKGVMSFRIECRSVGDQRLAQVCG